MLLAGNDGTRLGLRVAGYEFPGITRGSDANWLLIEIEADDGGATWRAMDPCLLTDELRRLALWLRSIALEEHVSSSLCFCEPELGFEVVEVCLGRVWLRAFFERHFRPPWLPRACVIGERDVFVNLFVGQESLYDASVDLLQQLLRFPEREIW